MQHNATNCNTHIAKWWRAFDACVSAFGSVLQCVAVNWWGAVDVSVTVFCSMLQYVAVFCNMLKTGVCAYVSWLAQDGENRLRLVTSLGSWSGSQGSWLTMMARHFNGCVCMRPMTCPGWRVSIKVPWLAQDSKVRSSRLAKNSENERNFNECGWHYVYVPWLSYESVSHFELKPCSIDSLDDAPDERGAFRKTTKLRLITIFEAARLDLELPRTKLGRQYVFLQTCRHAVLIVGV